MLSLHLRSSPHLRPSQLQVDELFDDSLFNQLTDPMSCESNLTRSIFFNSDGSRFDFRDMDQPNNFEYGDSDQLDAAAEALYKAPFGKTTDKEWRKEIGGKWVRDSQQWGGDNPTILDQTVCDILENPTLTEKTWNKGCGWNRVTLFGTEW